MNIPEYSRICNYIEGNTNAMKILINDGLHDKGKWLLEEAGIEVDDRSIVQSELINRLPEYNGIIVRSATNVDAELIDACPNLKFIGRGGVGLDNIDVKHAEEKGISVFNTPAASSRSVAELVFGHILNIARSIHKSNREMPIKGNSEFKQLKKSYSKGIELSGKTLGIIGLGRIGTESARIGVGMGMNVIGFDPFIDERKIDLDINGQKVNTIIRTAELDEVLRQSNIITVHVPHQKNAIIDAREIELLMDGVILVNASRGGIINEEALIVGLDSGKILGAGLDVYENEPSPRKELLEHPSVSVTPHIGASTFGAQEKIATELAHKIIALFDEN